MGYRNTSPHNKRTIFISISVLLMLALAIVLFLNRSCFVPNNEFQTKLQLLKNAVWVNEEISKEKIQGNVFNDDAKYIVFISICDKNSRAVVFHGSDKGIKKAWDKAENLAEKYVDKNDYETVWVKADIVTSTDRINSSDFSSKIKNLYNDFFRKGIAFDTSFNTALLEAELSGNKMINYDENIIDLKYMNNYLKANNKAIIEKIPQQLILFTCQGYFCDESNNVFELYSNDMDYGRRKVEAVDKELVKKLIHNSSMFLSDMVLEDGKFIYGYHPRFDNELKGYNILRHSGTIWALINQYKTTGDSALIPKIDSTIEYLIKNGLVYQNDEIAYIADKELNEIKLGGNAVAIITLIDYMEEFHTDKYRDIVIKLGNGIISLQDPEEGSYYHVLNYPDLSKKAQYRTVYYDGEATFALAKLYGFDKNQKWLDGAKKAVDHFIAEDYTIYRDHWVAYSLNEVTKYAPEERYFEFALRNVQNNMGVIYNQKTSYHTYLELLMITFELFDRIKTENIQVAYLGEFDQDKFIATIYHRARHMLNGYLYPEYAMYLEKPSRVVDTFCVRHDGFRVRIDDIQHFIGGYYYYYKNYDKLESYKNTK